MATSKSGLAVFLVLVFAFSSAAAPEKVCLIPGRGSFHVHANAGGLFAAFAHNHLIEAGKIEGCAAIDARNPSQSSVKLIFAAAGLRVLDPKESAENRAKIQKTMETEVLRDTEFPEITFESTGVSSDSSDRFRVRGNLTIRGKTEPVVIPVTVARLVDGAYRVTGAYEFKQSTFGIHPIRLIAGTVRVKDEVQTEFELYLK